MDQPASRHRVLVGIAVGAVLFGGVLVMWDWDATRDVLRATDWRPLVPALLVTAVSYICLSYSFAIVSRLLGIRLRRRQLAAIGFVSAVLNHLVQSGGVAGYSVRYALMRKDGVSLNDVLAASVLHFYLTSLAMQAMLPAGLAYLLLHASLRRGAFVALGVLAAAVLITFAIGTTLVFGSRTRRGLLDFLARVTQLIIRRDVRPTLRAFDTAMARGKEAMRAEPSALVVVMALVAADWIGSALALWFCFDALGSSIPAAVLFTGFVIGVMAGVLSMLPAGIGVQDASMAGVFALLGVSFEQAVLASVLFRVVYYLVPYLASLGFYWRLLPKRERTEATS